MFFWTRNVTTFTFCRKKLDNTISLGKLQSTTNIADTGFEENVDSQFTDKVKELFFSFFSKERKITDV